MNFTYDYNPNVLNASAKCFNTPRGVAFNITFDIHIDMNFLNVLWLIKQLNQLNSLIYCPFQSTHIGYSGSIPIVNYTLNFCEVMNKSVSNSFFKAFTANFESSSGIKMQCPIKKVNHEDWDSCFKLILLNLGPL